VLKITNITNVMHMFLFVFSHSIDVYNAHSNKPGAKREKFLVAIEVLKVKHSFVLELWKYLQSLQNLRAVNV
jgi:hypothetical protein